MGIFSTWQPIYAEAGLVTFPVHGDDKRPAVGNYLKAGRKASVEWAAKFGDSTALGFACGKRNGLTILDIDEPDETLLVDAMALLGQSPIVVQTASGKFHAWYRWNGEGRRPHSKSPLPGRKIDVLGAGFALAPPSCSSKGQYRFLSGSLADLARLPVLRLPDEAVAPPGQGSPREVVQAGERNDAMFKALMSAALMCVSLDDLLATATAFNRANLAQPLPEVELVKLVGNIWAKTERNENWFGTGRRLVHHFDDIDGFMQDDPDGFLLLTRLRREHEGLRNQFVVANAMANAMPGGGWSRKRFAAARSGLLQSGRLLEVRPASKERGPAVYQFGKIAHAGDMGEQGGRGVS